MRGEDRCDRPGGSFSADDPKSLRTNWLAAGCVDITVALGLYHAVNMLTYVIHEKSGG